MRGSSFGSAHFGWAAIRVCPPISSLFLAPGRSRSKKHLRAVESFQGRGDLGGHAGAAKELRWGLTIFCRWPDRPAEGCRLCGHFPAAHKTGCLSGNAGQRWKPRFRPETPGATPPGGRGRPGCAGPDRGDSGLPPRSWPWPGPAGGPSAGLGC